MTRLKTWYLGSFGRHPAKSLAVFTVVSSAFWVVQTSLCQTILPLDVIEAVVWGEEMQWGQMKSPPLSGWIAYFFSHATGHADWSLYLASQLTVVCAVYFVYRLAREFFSERGAATAAMLLYFLYYYMPPALKFCSHETQVALLPAVGFYFWRGVRDDRLRDWLLLALFAALATLGKYAAIQVLLGCAAFMLVYPPARRRFASPGPYLAGALYLLLLAPHIAWLYSHDFLPFKHLSHRLKDSDSGPAICLEAILTVLMPYALFAGVFVLAGLARLLRKGFRRFRNVPARQTARQLTLRALAGGRKLLRTAWADPVRRTALLLSLFLTLVPALFYLLPVFAGQSIVLMWFSYLASFTGITAVALLPELSHRTFRALLTMLWLYFAVLTVGVTIDALVKPRFRLHADPAKIVEMADRFYRKHAGDRPIPLVYGDRYLAGVVQNYSAHRPRACVYKDVCNLELYAEKMKKDGALVVFGGQTDYAREFRRAGFEPVPLEMHRVPYSARFGKKKTRELAFGYLPPEAERQVKSPTGQKDKDAR